MCESKYPTEYALIEHYNSKHTELLELGLKLRKSKALRKAEKEAKAINSAKTSKIVINQDEQATDKKTEKEKGESESSSDSDDSTDAAE